MKTRWSQDNPVRAGWGIDTEAHWIQRRSQWRRLPLQSLRLEKGKLTSESGREVLNDLEKAPDDADNRKAAEAALSKLLKSDPNALAELAQLLEKAGATSTTLTATLVGNENIVGQVSGSGTVSINKGPAPPVKPSKAN